MSIRKIAAFVAALIVSLVATVSIQAQEITVAAASDLSVALKEIAHRYEAKSGTRVKLTFGSSGNFFTAIQNGAPYDVYFSADLEYPKQLDAAGLTDPVTLYEYALGRLVLWAPATSPLNLNGGMKLLADPRVRKMAIANPKHAPYGRAAVAAMRAAGVYEKAESKLVLGENISQTFQFVQTGNADVGLVALSLISHPSNSSQGGAPEIEGKYWLVPTNMYPAIRQAAVVIKSSRHKDAAKKFLEFVKSDEGKYILKAYGFEKP